MILYKHSKSYMKELKFQFIPSWLPKILRDTFCARHSIKIAKALKEKEGVKIENVLNQIHKERES